MFKKEGYTTTYIHGNEGSFWNRYSVYSKLQIDNLIFDDVFDENTERINGYISDEEVYRALEEYVVKHLQSMIDVDDSLVFTPDDVWGIIYFLTGNCYIKWA